MRFKRFSFLNYSALGASVLLALPIGYIFFDSPVKNVPLKPLELQESSASFKPAIEQSAFRWPIQIYNPNDKPVSISDFTVSCVCSDIEPKTAVVPPKAASRFDLIIDTRVSAEARAHSTPVIPFSVTIRPHVESIPKQTALNVEGSIAKLFFVQPSQQDFGEFAEGDKLIKQISIKPLASLESLEVVNANTDWQITVLGSANDPECFLRFETKKPLIPGPFTLALSLKARSKLATEPIEVPLKVRGTLKPACVADPPALFLGSLKNGTSVTQIIDIRSRDGKNIRIKGFSCQSNDTQCEQTESTAAPVQKLKVTQAITMTGRQSRLLLVTLYRDDLEERQVSLPIQYIGVP